MTDNILAQSLWLLSIPEAAARVHGQHAKGRISISDTSLRSPTNSMNLNSAGILVARLLTEAIVFARNAITRFANTDRPDAAAPNPLAFSESLMQSQQDVLPALSAFQRALKAATEVTENTPDTYDFEPHDTVEPTDEVAARAGIAACHILLSIGHSDPRDAASSASDALRGLIGALRAAITAAAAAAAGGISSSGFPAGAASILQELSLGSLPCQICLLVVLAHNLERLHRIATSQIAVCRRETLGVIKVLDDLTSLASGSSSSGGGGGGGEVTTVLGGASGGSGGRISILVQLGERDRNSRKAAAAEVGTSGGVSNHCGLFLQALRETAGELRPCLGSSGSGDAAAALLEVVLRSALRRASKELERLGVAPPLLLSSNENGGGSGAAATAAAAASRLRGLSAAVLQLSGGSSSHSYSHSNRSSLSSGGGATTAAAAGAGLGGCTQGEGQPRVCPSSSRGSSHVSLQVKSSAFEPLVGGLREEEEDDIAAGAAAEAMAAADTAKATAQWLRHLPSTRSMGSDGTSVSLASSLSLSAAPASEVAAATAPAAAVAAGVRSGQQPSTARTVVLPLTTERLLLHHDQQQQVAPPQAEAPLPSCPGLSITLGGASPFAQTLRGPYSIGISTVASLPMSVGMPSSPSSPSAAAPPRVTFPSSIRSEAAAGSTGTGSTRVGAGVSDPGLSLHTIYERRSSAGPREGPEAGDGLQSRRQQQQHQQQQTSLQQQQQTSLQQLLLQQRSRLSQLDPSLSTSLPGNPGLTPSPPASPHHHHDHYQSERGRNEGSAAAGHSTAAPGLIRGRSHTVAIGGLKSSGSRTVASGHQGRGGESFVGRSSAGDVHNGSGGSAPFSSNGSISSISRGDASASGTDGINAVRNRSATVALRPSAGVSSGLEFVSQEDRAVIGGGGGDGSGHGTNSIGQRLARSPSWQEAAAAAVAAAAAAAAAGAWKPAATAAAAAGAGGSGLNSVASLGQRLSTGMGSSILATKSSLTGPGSGLLGLATKSSWTSPGAGSGTGIVQAASAAGKTSILAGPATAAAMGVFGRGTPSLSIAGLGLALGGTSGALGGL